MTRVEQAVADFKDGCNCCQAVIGAYAEDLGIERSTALHIATGFGAGMGRMAETCGAVSGACMALSLKYGSPVAGDKEAKARAYDAVREFADKFTARRGTLLCKELLDHDISTEEGWQQASAHNVFSTVCPDFVQDAAEILEEMLMPS